MLLQVGDKPCHGRNAMDQISNQQSAPGTSGSRQDQVPLETWAYQRPALTESRLKHGQGWGPPGHMEATRWYGWRL